MRNASDIFFLKEDNSDAANIFSVNGSCPLKIRRRRQTPQNDCFEYGRSQTELVDDAATFIHDFKDDNETEEENAVLTPRDLEVKSEDLIEKKMEIQEEQLQPKAKGKTTIQSLTTSSMKRNILTGAGMEIVEHRKPKKGLNRREKGLW